MLGRHRRVRPGLKAEIFKKRQRPLPFLLSVIRHHSLTTCSPIDTGTKLWLGTHVWHAKRMHMIDIWGYRLVRSQSYCHLLLPDTRTDSNSLIQAEKPTEKAYRSSYRAAFHGAMVHDASYYQYFQLDGPESELRSLLDKVCDPASVCPNSKRYALS
jgi:ribonuclease P/MRP protein subunit POP1